MEAVLCREKFMEPVQGCCGLMRDDRIYPVHFESGKRDFIQKALHMALLFGNPTDIEANDTYSMEYYLDKFEEVAPPERRGNGKSLYLLERGCDGLWHYSENGVEQFAVDTEELKLRWFMIV